VTAAYLFVDTEKSMVNYAGAAHPPLLLRRARTREVSEYVQNGLMLGPFLDSTYSAVTFSLEKGDRIVLMTDGIIEATDSLGNQFEMDRLRQILESNHALPASRFTDAVLDALSAWSEHAIGSAQSDDLTLLTIDFKGRWS